jgi:hypothetical protein
MKRVSKSAVLLAAVGVTAVAAPLAASGPGPGASSMVAQKICARIAADLGSTGFKRAYPKSGSCVRAMEPNGQGAIQACLRKGRPGTAPWRGCIDSQVRSAARSAGKKIGASVMPSPQITQLGPIGSIGTNSITIGSTTCTVGRGSPSLSGYKPDDRVEIECVNGVLVKITAPPAPPNLTSQVGMINALSPTSISVGPLTCTINSNSPNVSDYKLGDRVGIGCTDGVLTRINTPPA